MFILSSKAETAGFTLMVIHQLLLKPLYVEFFCDYSVFQISLIAYGFVCRQRPSQEEEAHCCLNLSNSTHIVFFSITGA